MTSEAQWLGLYNRLSEVLGQEHADTLVSSLVTKSDLAELQEMLFARFDRIDDQFDRIDTRFEEMDARLDVRFEKIDSRFEKIDSRFEKIDSRFDVLGDRFFQYYKNMLWTLVALTAIFSAVVTIVR